jgi:ELWxxDGT repeat protein
LKPNVGATLLKHVGSFFPPSIIIFATLGPSLLMYKFFNPLLFCLWAGISFTFAQTPIRSFQSVTKTFGYNNKIVLVANDGVTGDELWISDGTPEGTKLLKDIRPGHPASGIGNFYQFNDKLYFSAYTQQYENELWSTDGTPGGTKLVADLTPSGDYNGGTYPASFTPFKDRLYFTSSNGKLYRANAAVDDVEVVDQLGYSGRIAHLSVIGDKLYYYKGSDILHWTDGITKGDIDLPLDIENTYFKALYTAGGRLYAMRSSTYDTHIKLYVMNNATQTWAKIFDLKAPVYGSQYINDFVAMGDNLFFNIQKDYDNQPEVDELWRTNGTSEGTFLLKSFSWERHLSGSAMENFQAMDGELFFRSSTTAGRALWKTDGTVAGTVKVHDAIMMTPYNAPNVPAVFDGRLYFGGTADTYEPASLWSTDGTSTGTRKEFDLASNRGGLPAHLASSSGLLFFVTSEPFSAMLWSTAPAAEINVESDYGQPVLYMSTLRFSMWEENGCVSKTLTIRNDGKKALALGTVRVIGQDFLLDGSIPEMLMPGEKAAISVWFLPSQEGQLGGSLSIASSDQNESPFTINLSGEVYQEVSGFCDGFLNTFTHFLEPVVGDKPIHLSGTTVMELQPSGTTVGSLSLAGEGAATYSLVAGNGDTHNNFFTIDGPALKTQRMFAFGNQNHYAIRVRAAKPDQSTSEATFVISVVNKLNEAVGGECAKVMEQLDYQITGVASNSQGQLFTITSNGEIQRSDDDGNSWTVTNVGLGARLLRIFFIGDIGYITGDGVMFKSDDNGLTWFQLYIPQSTQYYSRVSAFFLTEEKGYIASHEGYIHYTGNGGRTWSLRKSGYSYGNNYSNLFFVNEQKGFATQSYNGLVMTEDGGRTWTEIDLSALGYLEGITAIHFINENEGMVLTYGALLRTNDGGKTWQKISSVSGGSLTSIHFKNAEKGFLIGNGVMYKTNDRGKTWASSYGPWNATIVGIASQDADLYISCGSTYGYYDRGRALFVSHDEGSTWETLSKLDRRDIYAMSFASDNVGFVCSEYNHVKTTDGGVTWKPVSWTTQMFGVHFLDESVVYFADRENIYRSTDGGESITKIYTTPTSSEYYRPLGRFYGATADLIFNYSSTNSSLYRSGDGGLSWTYVDTGLQSYLRDIHFISSTTGFIVDLFGSVYKSTDGGLTWNNVYERDPLSSIVTNSIFFINEEIGFKAGENFSVTNDGGVTWQDKFDPFYGNFYRIHFTSEKHGYAVLQNGEFHETSDGGASWKRQYGFSLEDVYSVEFRNGNVYFGGAEGYLSQYKNPGKPPLRPGYISGKDNVCSGDIQTYQLAPQYDGVFHWQLMGTVIQKQPSSVEVHFANPGDYTFSVSAANACGVSESRTLTVHVEDMELPLIMGREIVQPLAKESYEIENPISTSTYTWGITPARPFSLNESTTELTTTWPQTQSVNTLSVIAFDEVTGCRIKSEDFEVEVSMALDVETELEDGVSVFPNPASDLVSIKFEAMAANRVEIYTINGLYLFEKTLSPYSTNSISVGQLPQGLYILKLRTQNGKVITKKIVKK